MPNLLFTFLFLSTATFIHGVRPHSFPMPVDNKDVEFRECVLARLSFHRDVKSLQEGHKEALKLASSHFKHVLNKKGKLPYIAALMIQSKKHVCSLRMDDESSINERRAAGCLTVSHHQRGLHRWLKDAICMLETIARKTGNVCSQPNQRDVVLRRWRTNTLQDRNGGKHYARDAEIRSFVILHDVSEAIQRILKSSASW